MNKLSVRFQFPDQLVFGRAIQVGVVHPDEMKHAAGIAMLKGLDRANHATPIANGDQEARAGNLVGRGLCI